MTKMRPTAQVAAALLLLLASPSGAPVEIRPVAPLLIPAMLLAQRQHPELRRAKALRQATLAVLDDRAVNAASPAAWAPFTLVGEPGRFFIRCFLASSKVARPPAEVPLETSRVTVPMHRGHTAELVTNSTV
jgi:hypothetical protein